MEKEQLTLGKFIKLLEQEKQTKPIEFDFCGFMPTGIDSYRGKPSELAIGYERVDCSVPVEVVVSFCKAAIGKTYEGWKGGHFTMNEDTPLWVGNPGENDGTAIIGLADKHYVIIETANID